MDLQFSREKISAVNLKQRSKAICAAGIMGDILIIITDGHTSLFCTHLLWLNLPLVTKRKRVVLLANQRQDACRLRAVRFFIQSGLLAHAHNKQRKVSADSFCIEALGIRSETENLFLVC